jgi:hypothetical protein
MSVVVTKRSISSTSGDSAVELDDGGTFNRVILFMAYSNLAYMRSLFSKEAGDVLRSSIFGSTSL